MRLGHKNRVVKVVTSKRYVWEPCKTRAFTNPDSISISLVSLYTETLILHSALAFIKGFCFFLLPPHSPFVHTPHPHIHTPQHFFSWEHNSRVQVMIHGGRGSKLLFLKILAIFLLTHSHTGMRTDPVFTGWFFLLDIQCLWDDFVSFLTVLYHCKILHIV